MESGRRDGWLQKGCFDDDLPRDEGAGDWRRAVEDPRCANQAATGGSVGAALAASSSRGAGFSSPTAIGLRWRCRRACGCDIAADTQRGSQRRERPRERGGARPVSSMRLCPRPTLCAGCRRCRPKMHHRSRSSAGPWGVHGQRSRCCEPLAKPIRLWFDGGRHEPGRDGRVEGAEGWQKAEWPAMSRLPCSACMPACSGLHRPAKSQSGGQPSRICGALLDRGTRARPARQAAQRGRSKSGRAWSSSQKRWPYGPVPRFASSRPSAGASPEVSLSCERQS